MYHNSSIRDYTDTKSSFPNSYYFVYESGRSGVRGHITKYLKLYFSVSEAALDSSAMEDTVKQMERGTSFHKVRAINKIYPRKFKVDVENMRLLAESKKWWSTSGVSGMSETPSPCTFLSN